MPTIEHSAAASARLLYDELPPRAPTAAAQIVGDLGLTNDTPHVAVLLGGATRRATYLIPDAVKVGGACFVERLDGLPDAPLAVVAPNYWHAWPGTWGNTTGTWGATDGSIWGQGPPGAFDGP